MARYLRGGTISLKIHINYKTNLDSEREFISMHELHEKMEYSRDFSTWCKETLVRRGVPSKRLKRRNKDKKGAGRPIIDYYVNVNDFLPIRRMILTSKGTTIDFMKAPENSFQDVKDDPYDKRGEEYEE